MAFQQNALAQKVAGSKISEEEHERRLAKVDAQINSVASGFTDRSAEDIACAQLELAKFERGEGNPQSLEMIFRVAHDTKGQAETFGYGLATQIAGSLCQFIRSTKTIPSPDQVAVMKAHLDAVQLLYKQKIKGLGGEAGEKLNKKIGLAVSRVPPLE